MRAGRWQTTLGRTLAGRRLGLVGLGRLGRAMVPIAHAFGMRVAAWSSNLTPQAAADAGVDYHDKATLFAEADVISVHLLLSERSRHTVGAAELARMRPDAVLINTSRGPIVDTPALLAALHAGRIAGAGLDVYDTEPLAAADPLRSAPRTVLTPHLGYVSDRAYRVFYPDAVADIAAFLAGNPLRVLN